MFNGEVGLDWRSDLSAQKLINQLLTLGIQSTKSMTIDGNPYQSISINQLILCDLLLIAIDFQYQLLSVGCTFFFCLQ